ncbi:Hypothetical predicted protein [Mytilus galloprovincialis]|uniref:Uncharacterized protein n=1 Tax=Mytilus galloprovincialis TaxID=29158 RepID=A0A8B6FE89_MYTGA|nr:Hypothetical predicted protein [Mytilus galloprovincialis]
MEKLCPVAFGVIALLFLVGGAFSPGWMVMDSSRFLDMSDHDSSVAVTFHMGFFYLLIVGENYSMTIGYGSIPDDGGISYMDKLEVWDTQTVTEQGTACHPLANPDAGHRTQYTGPLPEDMTSPERLLKNGSPAPHSSSIRAG